MTTLRVIFETIFAMLILYELSDDYWAKAERAKMGVKENHRA